MPNWLPDSNRVLMWLLLLSCVVLLSILQQSAMAERVFALGALYLFGKPPGGRDQRGPACK
jgi:hypothetical protein